MNNRSVTMWTWIIGDNFEITVIWTTTDACKVHLQQVWFNWFHSSLTGVSFHWNKTTNKRNTNSKNEYSDLVNTSPIIAVLFILVFGDTSVGYLYQTDTSNQYLTGAEKVSILIPVLHRYGGSYIIAGQLCRIRCHVTRYSQDFSRLHCRQ